MDKVKNETKNLVPASEKKFVNVNVGAIQIQNKVSLLSRQAWFYLVYKAFPYFEKQEEFEITLPELKSALNYDSTNNKYLKQALKTLAGTVIEWNIFEKDKRIWEVNSMLAGCHIELGKGICTYSFSPFLRRRLARPEMYVKIDLIMATKKFSSKHSLALYCFALDYLQVKFNHGEKKITISELRNYLGLDEHEYPRVVNIHKEILKRAEQDINENTDINLSITPIRTSNRKIEGFKLEMSIKEDYLKFYNKKFKNNQQMRFLPQLEESDESKKEFIRFQNPKLKEFFAKNKIAITTNTIQEKLRYIEKLLKDNLENYILFLIDYAEKEHTKGNIKNFSAFFVSLIKNDAQIDSYLYYFEMERQKAEQKRSQIENMIEGKLKAQYEDYLFSDFKEFFLQNIDELEEAFIDVAKKKIKPDSIVYGVLIKRNKGIIDKTLITDYNDFLRAPLIKELQKYKEKFGYISIDFEEWKQKYITEEELNKLKKQLECLLINGASN